MPTAILRNGSKRWIIEDANRKPIHQLPSEKDALLWWRQYTKNPKARLKRLIKVNIAPASEAKSILPASNATDEDPAEISKRRKKNRPRSSSRSQIKEPPPIKKFEDYNLPYSDDFGMPECDYRK